MQKTDVVVKHSVIPNLIWNLQRGLLSFVNGMRGRSRIKYGMTSLFNNGGFTLIELLIVVLIIGVLSAVAVSQYNRAILKTRWGFIKAFMSQVLNQQQVYRLETGNYAVDLTELPAFEGWKKIANGQYRMGNYECLNKNHQGMEFACYYLKNRIKVFLVVFFTAQNREGMCRYNSAYPYEGEICRAVGAVCTNSTDCSLSF